MIEYTSGPCRNTLRGLQYQITTCFRRYSARDSRLKRWFFISFLFKQLLKNINFDDTNRLVCFSYWKNSSTLADHEQTLFEYKAVFADYNKCFEILDQAKTSVLSSLAIATSFGFQKKNSCTDCWLLTSRSCPDSALCRGGVVNTSRLIRSHLQWVMAQI